MPSHANRSSGNSQMRWWVLALAAIAVSSSYYNDDVIGPIADLLHRQRGFSQSQLGMLNGVISIPNVALALRFLVGGDWCARRVAHCDRQSVRAHGGRPLHLRHQ
jgi:hypothetical protein